MNDPSNKPITTLIALCFIVIATPVCADAAYEYATFSATQGRYTWRANAASGMVIDSLTGRHDELGLDPRSKDSIEVRFRSVGLIVGGEPIDPAKLSLTFQMIDQERAEVMFSAIDSTTLTSEVVWVTDSALEQPAGEFHHDVIRLKAGVVGIA